MNKFCNFSILASFLLSPNLTTMSKFEIKIHYHGEKQKDFFHDRSHEWMKLVCQMAHENFKYVDELYGSISSLDGKCKFRGMGFRAFDSKTGQGTYILSQGDNDHLFEQKDLTFLKKKIEELLFFKFEKSFDVDVVLDK